MSKTYRFVFDEAKCYTSATIVCLDERVQGPALPGLHRHLLLPVQHLQVLRAGDGQSATAGTYWQLQVILKYI